MIKINVAVNNKFFVIFFAPFLLGGITILGFAPYNLTFINFDHQDVMRHPLVTKIVEAYQKNTNDKG